MYININCDAMCLGNNRKKQRQRFDISLWQNGSAAIAQLTTRVPT